MLRRSRRGSTLPSSAPRSPSTSQTTAGWRVRSSSPENDDPEEVDEDQEMMANFIVSYEDGEDVPHFFVVDNYSALLDAPEGSWYVVGGQE